MHFISYPIANLFYSDSAYELYDEITFRENENQLKVYVSEILKGLVLLHSIGIIHNDMKPVSNFIGDPILESNIKIQSAILMLATVLTDVGDKMGW